MQFIAYYLETNQELYHELGRASVAQAKKVMPKVPIVQLARPNTMALDGVDLVHRVETLGPNWYKHMAQFHMDHPGSEVLCLDVDTWPQVEMMSIFKQPFDLAVCFRHEHMKNRPYNSGVVWSRHAGVWAQIHETWHALNKMTDDYVFCYAVNSGAYRLHHLPGYEYNYIPKTQDEDLRERKCVHFTGARKMWMREMFCQPGDKNGTEGRDGGGGAVASGDQQRQAAASAG